MARVGMAGARWIEPDDFHITLRFFGDMGPSQARELAGFLAECVARPFDIRIEGLGCFGGGHPKAIWAGVKADGALDELHRAHDRAARSAGLEPDPRRYTPHVTLARLRRVRPDTVARFLEAYGGFASGPFEASRAVLLSSTPGVGGGPYVIEDVYPFVAWGEDEDDEDWDGDGHWRPDEEE